MSNDNTLRYNKLAIYLHWLMLFLLIAVYATIELREIFPKGSDPRKAMKMWHFMLGLSVLCLVIVRIANRFSSSTPAIVPTPPAWQEKLAKLFHSALYLFMIVMPLAGWMILSAEGKVIPFFGLELPALIGLNKNLAETIQEIHETIGTAGYFLIGIHAMAAIYHHHFVKDNTVKRMLP